jgi:hypothetical protein
MNYMNNKLTIDLTDNCTVETQRRRGEANPLIIRKRVVLLGLAV